MEKYEAYFSGYYPPPYGPTTIYTFVIDFIIKNFFFNLIDFYKHL